MKFIEKLISISRKNNSLLCVGLDTDTEKIPKFLLKEHDPILSFNHKIIDSTCDSVCAYKPNIAFYEAHGSKGWEALKKTCEAIPKEIPIIIDAKRGDIGNTARMYAKAIFENLGADAVTVNPYMGEDAISPFLEYEDKCAFILCLTSNKGAQDFQLSLLKIPPFDMLRVVSEVEPSKAGIDGKPLYQLVAEKTLSWNKKGNCGLVVGATYPEQLRKIRGIADSLPILIPGIGAQSGEVESTVRFGTNEKGERAIINSSRGIIYASQKEDFAEAARDQALKLRDKINLFRKI